MRWPERLRAVLGAFALAGLVSAAWGYDAREYEHAARTILCDCGCHPQSVHDCACPRAAEMREEIRARIDQGQTGEEVIAAYVAHYGEQIRIAPVARGFSLLAWLGPLALLLGASAGLFFLLRRWSRRAAAAASSAPRETPSVPHAADPYVERLRRELEELR